MSTHVFNVPVGQPLDKTMLVVVTLYDWTDNTTNISIHNPIDRTETEYPNVLDEPERVIERKYKKGHTVLTVEGRVDDSIEIYGTYLSLHSLFLKLDMIKERHWKVDLDEIGMFRVIRHPYGEGEFGIYASDKRGEGTNGLFRLL